MATGRRVRAWLRRWVANPIASVVLATLLVADGLTLPHEWRNSTTAGRAMRDAIGWVFMEARPTGTHVSPDFYVVRGADGMRFIDENTQSWNALSSLLSSGDDPVAECYLRESVFREGFWAFTSEHYDRSLRVIPLTGEWTEADASATRAALFGGSDVPPSVRDRARGWSALATGDSRTSRVRWIGVGHNLLSLMVLVLLMYSVSGWRAWFAAHPLSRRSRRVARGLCLNCGYDLRGVGSGVCPECGHTMEPRA